MTEQDQAPRGCHLWLARVVLTVDTHPPDPESPGRLGVEYQTLAFLIAAPGDAEAHRILWERLDELGATRMTTFIPTFGPLDEPIVTLVYNADGEACAQLPPGELGSP